LLKWFQIIPVSAVFNLGAILFGGEEMVDISG
jgi:hypothetical protein